MGYSFDSRVRFSESGTDGHITFPAILDYFQDCCMFQVDSIHQGTKELKARNRVWVLSSWQVIVHRYPEAGEFVRTTTIPYQLKACFGHRNFTMEGEGGEMIAVANSLWTNLNIETGMPAKLTEVDLKGYVLDEKIDMPYAGRKIVIPENASEEEPFEVTKHHLDVNGHVNNVQYVRMAMDYLPADRHVKEMRAEYKKQAFPGDVFYPAVTLDGDTAVISFRTGSGEAYATVEFKL